MSRVKGQADRILEAFGERVLKLSRINLGRTYMATRPNGKKYRKRIDSSGALKKSLDYDLNLRGDDGRFIAGTIEFSMLDYGRFVDQGQKGTVSTYTKSRRSPFKRKQGYGYNKSDPSKSELIKWINKKIKRIQDLENGGFVKKTPARVQSLAFLISRKIRRHGIEATHFFQEPLESEYASLGDILADAVGVDYANAVSEKIDTLGE